MPRDFVCTQVGCDKTFSYKPDQKEHVKTCGKVIGCTCGTTFRTTTQRNAHMRSARAANGGQLPAEHAPTLVDAPAPTSTASGPRLAPEEAPVIVVRG